VEIEIEVKVNQLQLFKCHPNQLGQCMSIPKKRNSYQCVYYETKNMFFVGIYPNN
jgi:hypothetical protein